MRPAALWTIAELGAAAERALAVGSVGQSNGQIREIPDARTIRYYASLGLVDAPSAMRGRTALYGRRHLLQLVAVKRLQAAGRSLVEIQQQLLGLSDAALEPIAKVPADAGPPAAEQPAQSRHDTVAFWATPPAPVAANAASARTVQVIQLSETVSLLVEANEPPSAEMLRAIRAASEPLLRLLQEENTLPPNCTSQESP